VESSKVSHKKRSIRIECCHPATSFTSIYASRNCTLEFRSSAWRAFRRGSAEAARGIERDVSHRAGPRVVKRLWDSLSPPGSGRNCARPAPRHCQALRVFPPRILRWARMPVARVKRKSAAPAMDVGAAGAQKDIRYP
jgi:hypothetical protein